MTRQLLIAEDDPDMARLLDELAKQEGFAVQIAHSGQVASRHLHHDSPDTLLTDLRLPAPEGMELLSMAREVDGAMPVVVITGYATVQTAVEAFRLGAFDLITKPFDTAQVSAVLRRIRTLLDSRTRVEQLQARLSQLDAGIVRPLSVSRAMHKVMRLVEQVADLDLPVLLTGETGTGKGVVARALHHLSPRGSGPYFELNCASISPAVLESELFGHEKGAFTGAAARKRGLLELANGGTLLLDEINSAGRKFQSRLLQFTQERTVLRVGGERPIPVDVRLLCASNQVLETLVKAGRFRADLYYRLNVFPIALPPLRQRREDIAPLAEQFLLRFARQWARPARQFSAAALSRMLEYEWPGNVRELENVVQRAVVLADTETIDREHLAPELQTLVVCAPAPGWPIPPDASLAEVERYWIEHMLERCVGNKTEAARRLGIDPSTLHRKLKG